MGGRQRVSLGLAVGQAPRDPQDNDLAKVLQRSGLTRTGPGEADSWICAGQ